jgi:phosphoribosyl-dephospho-CoA transferase
MNFAHDIVLIDKQELATVTLPEWVCVTEKMYATVRRGIPTSKQHLLVGLRGSKREQRFGLEVPTTSVEATIHPWELVTKESFRQADIADYLVYRQYHEAQQLLIDCKWGVGGSLGFELATNQPTVKVTSDLDLLLYAETAAQLPLTIIQRNPTFFENVDIQVITNQGGFSLKEYLRNPAKKILLKTDEGPKLTNMIW